MTYTTSTTKTKAAKYDLPGIEDMVPNIWSPVKVAYDRYALWGISHWRQQRKSFYAYARGMQSRGDVYSTKRILAVTHVKVMRKHGYGYLEEIVVRRADNALYRFKEVLAKEKMEHIGKEKSSFHDQGHQQAAEGKEDVEENIDQKVNTVSGKKINTARPKAVVNVVKGNSFNVVKASAYPSSDGLGPHKKLIFLSSVQGNPQMDLQDQGNFKLIDESQVLLRVPRKNNMYSVDLENIVPKGGLTCLFTKATYDESNIWHRRLGHLNFKTMNKLVKGNLVRGLPFKLFENDQTCIACQKGKHHRASCKSKTENSISLPLYLLHMDLFGPTFVKSLMKKMYCLVVTNDYSRFRWVFFLATKDETSGILKSFITGIENLVDHKVKVIRCDNGTEFKNKEMNQFCEMKGILRQFSIARTPQQNRVAERRNRTLIEAARTMLADSNKAFRVFNSRTRIVEENLHIRFSENTPNVVGSGPDWLFDIDALTRTMNYEPIVAGTQSNGFAGTKASDNAGQARKETEPVKDYILLPLWTADPPYSQDPKSSHDDGSKPSSDDGKKVDEDPRKDSECNDQEKEDNVNSTNTVNAAGPMEVNVLEEPKKVIHALKDPSWIEAMQEELLQFKLQEVWTLVDLPNRKRAIGSKWVFRNKKDERGIVIRNKARLVAQGYTQEEGIDYDEVFAPVVRIEAIRLFLAYASFKDFVVYQMDVKSAFLYGKIEEEVYVCQPPRFEDPDFPDRVYKVEKALYGLHQAPRAWYETLSTYLLDNGFQRGKIDKTLFIKRHKGDILLVQVYVDDIIFGSTKKELCNAFEKLMP
ncbi:putative ribonuclease H-like domain-containing protein [Tanacetum coccineum]